MEENSHNLKIVVSADTSDAKKKLEDVSKTKIDPIEIDVVTDKVKVDTPKIKPVRVPVVTDKVKVDTNQVKPIDVVLRGKFNDSFIGKITNSIRGVQGVINSVMGAFGAFGLAVNGVMAVVSGIKALHEWLNRSETKAKELRKELENARYESSVANAAESYEKLNKSLAETLRLEKERSTIMEKRKKYARDVEDAKSEAQKQVELSGLDPDATDYAKRKSEIERRYELKSSETASRRANEDSKYESSKLYAEARSKDKEVATLAKELAKAQAIDKRATEKAFQADMKARSVDPDDTDKKKEAEDEQKAATEAQRKAYDFAKKIAEQMEKAKNEAASLRKMAAESLGGGMSAKINDQAVRQRIANEERVAKAEEERKRRTDSQRQQDAVLEQQKQEDIAALDPADKNYAANKAEIERTYSIKKAELKVERAETPEEKRIAETEKKTIGIQNEISRQEERKQRFDQNKSEIETFAKRAASFDGVSQNRLTAMGLGSGVSAKGSVESNVGRLVKLMEAQIQATKGIKIEPAVSQATYGD